MIHELFFSWPSRGACAVTLVLAAALSPVFADAATAAASAGSPEANYQIERADCLAGRTQQDQKTCLYEAVSAREAARKGLLATETPMAAQDKLRQRCMGQTEGAERAACDRIAQDEAAMKGPAAVGGGMQERMHPQPTSKQPQRAKPAERAASSAP